MGDPLNAVAFSTPGGPIVASTDCAAPHQDRPGARIRVVLARGVLQHAYDAGAFDLSAMIPGGDVPGVDPDRPVTIELRLADDPAALLAASSRRPGVLLGDLVALTEAGRDEHVLLDATNWLVTAVEQQRRAGPDLHLITLHDERPEVAT